MHILFISVLLIFVCTVGQFQSNNSHYDDSEINFAGTLTAQPARNHPIMPKRAAGPAVVQALGFKCIICDGEFASKHAADCHRRQPAFIGTQCALCRPKEHPITISDRTPGCFGWNSSPSQFCPPRSVNVHLISAIHTIHFLYQPRQAQASTYIPQ